MSNKYYYCLIIINNYFQCDTSGHTLQFVSDGSLKIPLENGTVVKIPLSSINISEEVNKTGIWKQVNNVNSRETEKKKSPNPVG